MADKRFYINKSPYSLSYIASSINAEIVNLSTQKSLPPEEIMISDITALDASQEGCLSFLSNIKYAQVLATSSASACIIDKNFQGSVPRGMWLLRSENAYYAYALALQLFYAPRSSGAHKSDVHPSVQLGKHVVIEDGVEIGENSCIGAGSFIGCGVKIGKNTRIDANVTISYSIIGDDVVILPGASIGQDGFGFATHQMKHHKIFHIGRVVIGNDVEIGANTTIDRGSLQDTVIEDGVRVDNLVQIGHNVRIGRGSIVVAQVGIAGSSKVGNFCALGGQVGVSGHVTIADRVQIAGQGGVIQDVLDAGVVLGGTPAVPIRDWHRQSIALRKLVKQR
jgi:UDP-3-O-[3-hydroxymyristoyl] glucosamine N-acyltransferase